MPTQPDFGAVIPAECPRCRKTLYSSTRLRPELGLSARGKLLMGVGVLVSAILFVGFGILIRAIGDANGFWVPGKVLGPLLMVPCVIPGLVIGILAHRMAKVRRVQCWNCKWSAIFPAHARWAPAAAVPAAIRVARPVVSAAVSRQATAVASALNQVVDDADPWEECTAWAYAEIRRGHTPEEVEAQLVAAGWPADDVAGMVERCRGEARHQPAADRAARSAAGTNPLPEHFTGTQAAQIRGRAGSP